MFSHEICTHEGNEQRQCLILRRLYFAMYLIAKLSINTPATAQFNHIFMLFSVFQVISPV